MARPMLANALSGGGPEISNYHEPSMNTIDLTENREAPPGNLPGELFKEKDGGIYLLATTTGSAGYSMVCLEDGRPWKSIPQTTAVGAMADGEWQKLSRGSSVTLTIE